MSYSMEKNKYSKKSIDTSNGENAINQISAVHLEGSGLDRGLGPQIRGKE